MKNALLLFILACPLMAAATDVNAVSIECEAARKNVGQLTWQAAPVEKREDLGVLTFKVAFPDADLNLRITPMSAVSSTVSLPEAAIVDIVETSLSGVSTTNFAWLKNDSFVRESTNRTEQFRLICKNKTLVD